MKVKHFINLTNGIEIIPKLYIRDINFIRIQSTTLECKNWYKFFMDIDHNLLMYLALGFKCIIYDYGCKRPNSKTIYMGIPILEYCINKYWFNNEMEFVMVGRSFSNQKQYIEEEIYKRYFLYHDERLLNSKIDISIKYKYYRRFIKDINKINIVGYSESTENDSNIGYYNKILNKYVT